MATQQIIEQFKPVIRTRNSDGFSACALVGINSVLLGWNMDESINRKDFMGFAVNRSEYDPKSKELLRKFWLNGQKRFKNSKGDIGIDVRSDQGPFQRFRWSDYTVHPSKSYSYEVIPMFGKPNELQRAKSMFLNLRPSPQGVDGIEIYSNRGVTAAFAYLQRFGNNSPENVPNQNALKWLSRGLKESLLNYISRVKKNEEINVCIYEFHDEEIAQCLKEAKERGVQITIIYDAGKDKSKKKNEKLLKKTGLLASGSPRSNVAISHNKFVIHCIKNEPVSVWTGTCNFSSNAFYKQTNQAIIFEKKQIAKAYKVYFDLILSDPVRSKFRFKKQSSQYQIEELNASLDSSKLGLDLSFSPTSKKHVIDIAIEAISKARSAIFVSSPFSLDKNIIQALLDNKNVIIEYGLVNATAKNKISKLKNRNSRFLHPTRLETYLGRSWDAKAFGAHKIHTKSIVIDPWSKKPTMIFGSANFSDNSSRSNDENMIVSNDRRLSSVFASEFIRMYDHYKSRYFINEVFKGKAKNQYLSEDGLRWTKTAFNSKSNSFKFRDRLVFSGYI